MILLLGATRYIGQAFARELRRRGSCFIPLSRQALDYTRFELLFDYVRRIKPALLINAAEYSGARNADECETVRMETFQTNTLLPQTIAQVCMMTSTPWAHVSSGAIFSGAKVFEMGEMRVEKDLNDPKVRQFFRLHKENFFGFTESDEPNFSFRCAPCSFFAGTKALAEEALRGNPQTYIWRPNLPFGDTEHPSNLLTGVQSPGRIHDRIASLSHVDDFVRACLDLIDRQASFGIYNVTNPGAVTARQIVEMVKRILKPARGFEFWTEEESQERGEAAAGPSCILDVTKLLSTGVRIRPVELALEDALERWKPLAKARRSSERKMERVSAN